MKKETVEYMLEKLPSNTKTEERYRRLVRKATAPNSTDVGKLLREKLRQYKKIEFRASVDKLKAELTGPKSTERAEEVARLVSKAQKTLRKMVLTPQFAKYLARIFRNSAHIRYAQVQKKYEVHMTDTLLFVNLPYTNDLKPKIHWDYVLVIATEIGTPEMKADRPLKILTVTYSKNNGGLLNLRVEVQNITYYSETRVLEFTPCGIYSSQFIDQGLRALSRPESTIDLLVERYGDGNKRKEATYCIS